MATCVGYDPNKLGFLSLPREVRDLIYVQVLSLESSPLEAPAYDESRIGVFVPERNQALLKILYPLTPSSYPCQSFVECNQQIGREVGEMTDHLATMDVPPVAKLQVMVDANHCWPTWIRCPGRVERLHELQVDVQLWHTMMDLDLLQFQIIKPLFILINQFVYNGPRFLSPDMSGRRTRVDRCNIKISWPGTWFNLCTWEQCVNNLVGDMAAIACDGALSVYIARIIFCSEYERIGNQEVNCDYPEERKRKWEDYGFYWMTISPHFAAIPASENLEGYKTKRHRLACKFRGAWNFLGRRPSLK